MNEKEQDIVEKIREGKRIGIYELIRTFKKEGIENFITVRRKYIDILLNLLATQSKQIDLMAKEIHISNIFDCDFKHFKDNKCRLKYPDVPNEYKCKDCIKEYFKKKASEEE